MVAPSPELSPVIITLETVPTPELLKLVTSGSVIVVSPVRTKLPIVEAPLTFIEPTV